jgi:mannitol/fructose-specific phosphotransferase system IIA component (Ntr-type)
MRLVGKGTLMRDRDDDSHGLEIIEIPAASSDSPEGAIHFLMEQLIAQGSVRQEDAERIEHQVLSREALGSTAIGRGVALPHAKSDVIRRAARVVGRCRDGDAFARRRGRLPRGAYLLGRDAGAAAG